jgi:hypothetical protein
MIIAPIIRAISALEGMPKDSIGMNDVWAPALLPDSGASTSSIAPLPNSAEFFETLRSSVGRRMPLRCAPWHDPDEWSLSDSRREKFRRSNREAQPAYLAVRSSSPFRGGADADSRRRRRRQDRPRPQRLKPRMGICILNLSGAARLPGSERSRRNKTPDTRDREQVITSSGMAVHDSDSWQDMCCLERQPCGIRRTRSPACPWGARF